MKVHVKTPARLHFGLIDLNGGLGRIFGGIGVGIEQPNFILEAEVSEELRVDGLKKELVELMARRFLDAYNLKGRFASLNLKQEIPEHVGLGSGTQLALAVATSLAKLLNVEASTQELALVMGRARRTGVGTAIFEKGGFVVDGGKHVTDITGSSEGFPPVIFHQSFPEDWMFVVAVPNGKPGLSADREVSAFESLSPMPVEKIGKICRLTMMKLLPALLEHDIENFGEALTQIQLIVGEQFAKVQSGIYSSETVRDGIELMRKLEVHGLGQSSWGPSFYGLCHNEKEAEKIQLNVQKLIDESVGGRVFTAKANNRGAQIRVDAES